VAYPCLNIPKILAFITANQKMQEIKPFTVPESTQESNAHE